MDFSGTIHAYALARARGLPRRRFLPGVSRMGRFGAIFHPDMRALLPFALLSTTTATCVLAAPPAAPTGVVAYAPNERQVHLSWEDVEGEMAYWIDRWDPKARWEPGEEEEEGEWIADWVDAGVVGADFEVYRGSGFLAEEQTVKYRICAVNSSYETSDWVETEVEKPLGVLDLFLEPGILEEDPEDPENPAYTVLPREIPEGIPATAAIGDVMHYQIPVFNGTPSSYFAEHLPPLWSVNFNTGLITGVVPPPGVYRFFVGVKFDGNKEFKQVRFLRVLPPASTPRVAKPSFSLPKQRTNVRGYLDISEIFQDPGRPYGAWFYTNEGSVVVALHHTATPKTVANFLGYAERGDYDSTFIHRSAENFVIQGGGYRPLSATSAPNQWRNVTTKPSVFNEPGLSNTRRTISMAKLGTNRDSATSQWFFNFGSDNASNLDYQNGGFTAFGEVVGSVGMQVVDRIANFKTGAYSLSVLYSPTSFSELPIRGTGAESVLPESLAWKDLVVVHSVVPAPPVEISLVSNSAPNVLNASVDGMLLFLEAKGRLGTARLHLRATNLDGNTVDFVLPVTIDDFVAPTFRITSLRSVMPYGTVLMRGRAKDDIGLGKWRYKLNNKGWRNGGKLKGKSAIMKAKIRGFRSGRNMVRIEVFDARKNSTGALKLPIRFR